MDHERVASTALTSYSNISKNGKPKFCEWTVLAGIVCEELSENSLSKLNTIAIATGNKCLGRGILQRAALDGYRDGLLRDSHAEVLCRRSLLRILYADLQRQLKSRTVLSNENCLLELIPGTTPPRFKLRSDIKLHLYVSEPPCGDAAIFELDDEVNQTCADSFGVKMNFSGAKMIVPSHEVAKGTELNIGVQREPETQELGVLRLKSGRSDISIHDRTLSMCCSDKLLRWCLQGLQGNLLSQWIEPFGFSSIVVSKHPKASLQSLTSALSRAIPSRCLEAIHHQRLHTSTYKLQVAPPSVHVISLTFDQASYANHNLKQEVEDDDQGIFLSLKRCQDEPIKPNTQKKKRKKQLIPCDLSLNWYAEIPFRPAIKKLKNIHRSSSSTSGSDGLLTGVTEVTAGVSGLKQGANRKNPTVASYSRLCSHSLFEQWLLTASISDSSGSLSALPRVSAPTQPNKELLEYNTTKEAVGALHGTTRAALVANYGELLSCWVDSCPSENLEKEGASSRKKIQKLDD